MGDRIQVHVRGPADRPYWMLQWRDPVTGLIKSRSSQVRRAGVNGGRTEAERAAALLQAELEAGLSPGGGRIAWETFRERYESEHMPSLTAETAAKIQVVFGLVDRVVHAKRLIDVGEQQLSHLAATLRREEKSESTIHSYLATLKAILNWARRQKLINACPNFPLIQRRRKCGSGDLMKGRAPTDEEFNRILSAVPHVIGTHGVNAWTHYLKGLWLSGLRLRESMDFWWDRRDRLHPVFPGRGNAYFRVFAESEKGFSDRHLPMTPDFVDFLQRTPVKERTGRVFKLPGMRKGTVKVQSAWAGKLVSKIGEHAKVVVEGDLREPEHVKFASAHDLRRAFGERWAALVEVHILQQLMRHESIETTMRYYVGRNADRAAEACLAAWAARRQGPGSGRMIG